MSNTRTVIYISDLIHPSHTHEFQEKWGRKKAKALACDNITVYKDTGKSRENFAKMANEIMFYGYMIITSLGNIGNKYQEIIDNLGVILKNKTTKLISLTESLNVISINEFCASKNIMAANIQNLLYSNILWKELKKI